jgi:hypothetical protein
VNPRYRCHIGRIGAIELAYEIAVVVVSKLVCPGVGVPGLRLIWVMRSATGGDVVDGAGKLDARRSGRDRKLRRGQAKGKT